MYGLYKYKKKYYVRMSNKKWKKKQLIIIKMLSTIAKNLNLKVPVVQLSKYADKDYYYSDSEDSNKENISVQSCPTESNNITKSSLETSLNVSGQKICDDINLQVKCSNVKGTRKQNFCYYCKKIQSKIRHLERVHKDEEIIRLLRRRDNYLFNTDSTYNKGELIVCRRPTESKKRTARDFIVVLDVKAFLLKIIYVITLKSARRKQKVQSRIHDCANSILRNVVFPVLREDDVIRLIRYDELLITYDNKLSSTRYNIRSRLRLLGRFLQALKDINKSVIDFYSIYHPSIYDDCIKAVNKIAGFNTNTKIYTSSIASRIATLIKQIGNLGIAECIKSKKLQKKMDIENFPKLLQTDFNVSVNKTVEETILQAKRYKLQDLLPLEDIKLLHNFLQTNRRSAFQQLTFTYNNWRQLAQFLISVQVFNRRRAGKIERISIDDYNIKNGIFFLYIHKRNINFYIPNHF
ncbi:hypothetical protein ACFW04_012141 [Cataglyphis niger]